MSSSAGAANAADWDAGNIIDDRVFTDNEAMSIQEIQNFLNEKIGGCDIWGTGRATEYNYNGTRAQYAASRGWAAPPYTCLNHYYEVPKLSPGGTLPANNFSNPSAIPAGAQSAAWIIKDAANRYGISPKVLLVKIATESAGPLTSDKWPLFSQYRYAMGARCPDSGPNGSPNCDANYAGFSIQMYEAAKLLRGYLDNMDQSWWSYKKPKQVNNILWNVVERGCGGSNVYIQNKATAALYTYTPYQPNRAALNNLYGTGDGCSAYGNRNFWRVFVDWFGPSRFTVIGGIRDQYDEFGGASKLGYPTMNEACGLTGNACFQDFERGSIYWTPARNKGFTVFGGMLAKWSSLGKEWSWLGYPISNETGGQIITQQFERGQIIYSSNGVHAVRNEIEYSKFKYLGNPRDDTRCGIKANGCYQVFDRGTVFWSANTGAMPIFGGMLAKWEQTGKEWGPLGYPTSGEALSGGIIVQQFEQGRILYSPNGAHTVLNKMDYTTNFLGNPKDDTRCGIKANGCYQVFDRGQLYQSANTGSKAIFGGIYQKWEQTGKEWGPLGYPKSNEYSQNGAIVQDFEFGKISWTLKDGARVQ